MKYAWIFFFEGIFLLQKERTSIWKKIATKSIRSCDSLEYCLTEEIETVLFVTLTHTGRPFNLVCDSHAKRSPQMSSSTLVLTLTFVTKKETITQKDFVWKLRETTRRDEKICTNTHSATMEVFGKGD
jgi:hypothetical protein